MNRTLPVARRSRARIHVLLVAVVVSSALSACRSTWWDSDFDRSGRRAQASSDDYEPVPGADGRHDIPDGGSGWTSERDRVGTREASAPVARSSSTNSSNTNSSNTNSSNTNSSNTNSSNTRSTSVRAADREFVMKAAQGGLFEVSSSRLAVARDVSPKTREFATRMIEDHGKANDELESIARGRGVAVPMALDAEHQGKLDELSRSEGADFDDEFRTAQVRAHDDAIALFERAASNCEDPELRAFAERTLPTLRSHRSHLDMLGP